MHPWASFIGPMDTIVADCSQFDFPHGSASCTSAALLFARYSLEGIPSGGDINMILEAAALLWKKWKVGDNSLRAFQTWKNVQNTFPIILSDVDVVHETNGFFGSSEENEDYLLGTVEGCIDRMEGDAPRGAVITSNSASYGLAQNGGVFYFFDSHGCDSASGKAYVTRLGSPAELYDFVGRHMSPGAEFTAVILQKRSADTGDTRGAA